MNIDAEVLTEIKVQLQDDILYFGWLCQLVRLIKPQPIDTEYVGTVVEAVIQLHQAGTIIIGNAREVDGVVLIEPWPERDKELRARVEWEIENANERDRDFCFWIQLADHATTQPADAVW